MVSLLTAGVVVSDIWFLRKDDGTAAGHVPPAAADPVPAVAGTSICPVRRRTRMRPPAGSGPAAAAAADAGDDGNGPGLERPQHVAVAVEEDEAHLRRRGGELEA